MNEVDSKNELDIDKVTKQTEAAYKLLLKMEIVIVAFGLLFFLSNLLIAVFIEMPTWLRFLIGGFGFVAMFIAFGIGLRLEQKAGFYECANCHHRHAPTYMQINFAMHMGRTRYLKCPHCGKRTWNKKVLSDKIQ